MTRAHKLAAGVATIGALLLIAGMLFGNRPVPDFIGGHGTVRSLAIALWAFALPWWFEIEEWFVPEDDARRKRFERAQKYARRLWIGIGAMVAIIIGVSAPQYKSPQEESPATNAEQNG